MYGAAYILVLVVISVAVFVVIIASMTRYSLRTVAGGFGVLLFLASTVLSLGILIDFDALVERGDFETELLVSLPRLGSAESAAVAVAILLLMVKILNLEFKPAARRRPTRRQTLSRSAVGKDAGLVSAEDAADAWIDARADAIEAALARPDGIYTAFVASAQGGGLYAAAHAAGVLAKL